MRSVGIFLFLISILKCFYHIHGLTEPLTFSEKADKYLKLMKDCKGYANVSTQSNHVIDVNAIKLSNSDDYIIKLSFYVYGEKDVRIILSKTIDYEFMEDDVYEIVIGAWENTRTAIRKRANDYPDLTNEMTIDLLGKDVPVNVLFTISKFGEIALRLESPYRTEVLSAIDYNPTVINYITFTSYDDAPVEVFFNCLTTEKRLSSASLEDLSEHCIHRETYTTEYRDFIRISELGGIEADGLLRFSLFINASTETSVLLSSERFVEWSNPYLYEIVFGAKDNSRIILRSIKHDDEYLAQVQYTNVFPKNKFLIALFEINKTGLLRLFIKHDLAGRFKLVLTVQLEKQDNLHFISLHSSNYSPVDYYYNCPYIVKLDDFPVLNAPKGSAFPTKTDLNADCKFVETEGKLTDFIRLSDFDDAQPDGYLAKIPLYVQSASDVRILLATTNHPNLETDKIYEIVIGAWNNTRSVIRTKNSPAEEWIIASVLENDVLFVDSVVKIEVEIKILGDINVQVEDKSRGLRPLLLGFDTKPVPISSIAFSTYEGNTASIYYDCIFQKTNQLDKEEYK